jgi:hypothetical protein
MHMRAQIDRFEDGGWAVVLPCPDGGNGSDVPRDLFPDGTSVGGVFDVRLERDRGETGRQAGESRRLPEGLAGGGR